MPLRVHAIVVTRHGPASHARVLRSLEAVAAQTRPAQSVTLVVCGDQTAARESAGVAASVTEIVGVGASATFSAAVAAALTEPTRDAAVWILDDDCVPAPEALELLTAALERSPMAAIAAPKLVTETGVIASYGVSMSGLGRAVELTAGQLDQGQHDGDSDALAADVRGMLVRGMARDRLVPDAALSRADVGLDLGVRARLEGARLVLTPAAQIVVSGTGPAAPPRSPWARSYLTRRAQLHRRLAYAPAPLVPLHWLALLPLALLRSLLLLMEKQPGAVLPELGAALVTALRPDLTLRARSRIRRARRVGWATIRPLRIRRGDAGRKLVAASEPEGAVTRLRFFAGGGAWAVLIALAAGVAAFAPLLAWPVLGGGGLLPLRETLAGLWSDAGWGMRALGVDIVGPADPFAGVLATLGTLSPLAPSGSLVVLWLLALPLALLGGWFAATRLSERASLRLLAGICWAASPTFLTALAQGRPAAVTLHLVLPWLFFAGAVAHRSWGASGAASLVLLPVLACAPSLAPALLLLWAAALVVALVRRSFAGAARIAWIPVPAVIAFAPLLAWQLEHAGLAALMADPGLPWAGPQAGADAAGRLLLALGFPGPDVAGWDAFLGGGGAPAAALLLAPLALLAVLAPVSPRWRLGMTLYAVAASGLATALVAPGVWVSFAQGAAVPLWPGSGLSLAWIGIVGAALITIDSALPRPGWRRATAGLVAVAAIVCALPALTALARGESLLQNGPESTLPAYVAADARGDAPRATLVITPLAEAAIHVRAVWGHSDTLGAQATIVATATEPLGADLSGLAVDLISPRVFEAAEELAARGISYVLLAEAADETAPARELRLRATLAVTQRADLVKVGDTDKGTLWRVDAEPLVPQLDAEQQARADRIRMLMLAVFLAALLLALPTRASRRAARLRPRVVGGAR